jgi:hypothetical protein
MARTITGTVQLLGVPVRLFLSAEQHASDLLREATYVVAQGKGPDDSVYHRFLQAARAARMRETTARNEIGDLVEEAFVRGDESVDLTLPAHEQVAMIAEGWSALLDAMDAECYSGRVLSLPASPELVRFQHWFCEQICGQVRAGLSPTPFV